MLVQVQVHVPNVVFCGFYKVLCACSRAGAGAGAVQLQVQLQEQVLCSVVFIRSVFRDSRRCSLC